MVMSIINQLENDKVFRWKVEDEYGEITLKETDLSSLVSATYTNKNY